MRVTSKMMTDITWRPHIGDPDWIGWITVLAYAIAAWLCLLAGRRIRRNSRDLENGSATMWFVFATGMVLLGVNKQLDLQIAFMQLGRNLAQGEGWYQQRRLAQVIFVLLLGAALTGSLFIAFFKQKHFFKCHVLTCWGSIFLAAFIFLRAALFNHANAYAGISLGEGHWMDFLELGGILCFILASVRFRASNDATTR
jgi:hypothetical protein